MHWKMSRWVWVLKSPLHVGTAPAGALNRTRLFIPAYTIWGAITAAWTRQLHTPASPRDYQQVGAKLRENFRFSYLFPATRQGNQWNTWLPRYTERGLFWEREDGKRLPDRAFRQHLLDIQPGTAINPSTDTANEGSLRETEVILPYWKGETKNPQHVAFVGYVFWKKEDLFRQIQEITEIVVGGDTRYGLGRMEREAIEEDSRFWNQEVDLDASSSPRVLTQVVFAHTQPVQSPQPRIRGNMELLQKWDWNEGFRRIGLFWEPGSICEPFSWIEFSEDGLWKIPQPPS